MKVAIPILGLTSHGGIRVLVGIANELARRNHQVEIFIPAGRNFHFYTLHPKIKIKEIGSGVGPKRLSYIIFLFLVFFHLKGRLVLANYFLTVLPTFISNRVYGTRYVYFVQDIEYRFFTGFLKFIFRFICHWTYKKGNIVTANSYLYHQISSDWLVDFSVNIGPSSIFFSQPDEKNKKDFDVVYFLRSERHKRLDRFDQFLKLASGQIKIACVAQDSRLFSKYKSRVEQVFQPQNDSELIKVLDRSRIFLLTSDHEGFALPPLEAMARGVPPVLFNCGGPSLYCVNLVNGMIIDDEDIQKFFNAIVKLLKDNILLNRLSQKAKETSLAFNLEKAVQSFCDFLESKDKKSQINGNVFLQ